MSNAHERRKARRAASRARGKRDGRAHTFPERDISWRTCRATKPYRCESLLEPRPAGCRDIDARTPYTRVTVHPTAGARARWINVTLCHACATAYGLRVRARGKVSK